MSMTQRDATSTSTTMSMDWHVGCCDGYDDGSGRVVLRLSGSADRTRMTTTHGNATMSVGNSHLSIDGSVGFYLIAKEISQIKYYKK